LYPFRELQIKVDVLQSDPLALYNYLAFDYFNQSQGALCDDATAREVTAALEIGANSSNLVIGNGSSVWMRNLPLGASHFNKPLISQLQLTWQQSEEVKRNPLKTPWISQMYEAMDPALRDFVGELQRSIGYFEHTYKHRTIQELLLVGNGAKLHGLIRRFYTPKQVGGREL
jgi:type IV pilus assembly protein PilM